MNPLSDVTSWLYHLGGADAARIEAIGASDVGLVVVDNADDSIVSYTSAQVDAMRGANDKLVVSYLSVGEAENYRPYWQTSWDDIPPDFLAESNPEWPNNFKVKYWDDAWKSIVFDYIDEIVSQGFNGLYLDIVDAFYYWEEVAPRTDDFYRQEMVSFVQEIDAHADAQLAAMGDTRDFVVIGQNGEALAEYGAYLEAIDGIAKEDLYFYYENGRPQDFAPKSDASRARNKEELERAEAAGVEVMVVEYIPPEHAAGAAQDLAAERAFLEEIGAPLYVADERDLRGIYTSYELGGQTEGTPPEEPPVVAPPVVEPPIEPPVEPEENDTLVVRSDTPVLDGGAGFDTAVFDGDAEDYVIAIDGAEKTITIIDKREDGTGTHRLESVERLHFDEGLSSDAEDILDLTQFTGAAALTAGELTSLVEMYVAYFDRAPDAKGLLYWGGRLADGMGLAEIAQSFWVQPEAREAFPDPEDARELVHETYDNLFDRDPDDAGEAYWVERLESGEITEGAFVLAAINGAKAATGDPQDAQIVVEKGQIGFAFAVENGLSNVDHADEVMDLYDTSDREGSRAEALALIAEYRAEAEMPDSEDMIMALVGLGEDPLAIL